MTICVGLEVYLRSLLATTLYEGESSASLPMALPWGGGEPRVFISYEDWWAPEPVWILEKIFFCPSRGSNSYSWVAQPET